MLNCKKVTEIVNEYLEGRLSFIDNLRFKMHLVICKNCREYVNQMKQTIEMTGEISDAPIPDEVYNDLLKHFDNWKSENA